jgi:hypothetical protein
MNFASPVFTNGFNGTGPATGKIFNPFFPQAKSNPNNPFL